MGVKFRGALLNPAQGSSGQWLAIGRCPGCWGLPSGRDVWEEREPEWPELPVLITQWVLHLRTTCASSEQSSLSAGSAHPCFPGWLQEVTSLPSLGPDGGKVTLDSIIIINF